MVFYSELAVSFFDCFLSSLFLCLLMYESSSMSVDPFMGARALSRDSTLGACTRAALDKSPAERPFSLSGSRVLPLLPPGEGFVRLTISAIFQISSNIVEFYCCFFCQNSSFFLNCRRIILKSLIHSLFFYYFHASFNYCRKIFCQFEGSGLNCRNQFNH